MFDVQAECLSLDADATLSPIDLAACCGLSVDELNELVDYRALAPIETATTACVFSARWVGPLRAAAQMRIDYDLDLFSVSLMLGQLERIAQLEQELRSLRALLPAGQRGSAHE